LRIEYRVSREKKELEKKENKKTKAIKLHKANKIIFFRIFLEIVHTYSLSSYKIVKR
jgi:hypothetical protein